MSNFNCDKCGLPIIEGESGSYITGCSHYPIDVLQKYRTDLTDVTFIKFPEMIISKYLK